MPTCARAIAILLLLTLFGCGFVPDNTNVKVNEAPAEGLTDASFDHGYLQQLIESTRQAAEQRLIEAYNRNRIPTAERNSHANTSGRYEQNGSHTLAIVELSYSGNPMRVTRIVGIRDDRLITISCISPRGEPIDPFAATGECAESVRKHLPLAP
jgi:hypothetical protein